MITRRAFLSALCAIPFVSRLPSTNRRVVGGLVGVAEAERRAAYFRAKQFEAMKLVPKAPYVYMPEPIATTWDKHIWIASGDKLYYFEDDGSFDADRIWSSVQHYHG